MAKLTHLKRFNESEENINIPTAEEFFNKYSQTYSFEEGDPEHLVDEEDFKRAMIEFAKLHVNAALEAASVNAEVSEERSNPYDPESTFYIVDSKSILNAYPDKNIK
jgi:hypothetical protein